MVGLLSKTPKNIKAFIAISLWLLLSIFLEFILAITNLYDINILLFMLLFIAITWFIASFYFLFICKPTLSKTKEVTK